MKENAFFTLPLIGSFIYFVISCLITISSMIIYFDLAYFWELIKFSPFNIINYLLKTHILDVVFVFGILSLFLHSLNVHIINKTNVELVIIIMVLFSVIAYFIPKTLLFDFGDLYPIKNIFIIIISVIFYLILYSLLLYYLLNFSNKYFIKNQQPFPFTATNSTKIHFKLFAIFTTFVLIKGYLLITKVFQLFSMEISNNILNIVYISGILIAVGLTMSCFKQSFDKIQTDRLIKSIIQPSIIIFICIIVNFIFIFKVPTALLYKNIEYGNLLSITCLMQIVLLPLIIALILNKVTKRYFYYVTT